MPIIKSAGKDKSHLNIFDLLGHNEVGLSKAFAYVLAQDPEILFNFLQCLGVSVKNTPKNHSAIAIEIERHRNEGRTDIEIKHSDKFHVIIECKVNSNRIKNQNIQYIPCFESQTKQKIMCFITQERDDNREIAENINIFYTNWAEVIERISNLKSAQVRHITKEFLEFANRESFSMKNQKEVLIQDMSIEDEIDRFKNYYLYRRDVTYGTPLYFAPYFTRKAHEEEGIKFLSKILGVITARPSELKLFEEEIFAFTDDQAVAERWLRGCDLGEQNNNEKYTYYFLSEPVALGLPLLKDGGNKAGRGKNWIAAMIPKNRCVSFEEFTKRIIQSYDCNKKVNHD